MTMKRLATWNAEQYSWLKFSKISFSVSSDSFTG